MRAQDCPDDALHQLPVGGQTPVELFGKAAPAVPVQEHPAFRSRQDRAARRRVAGQDLPNAIALQVKEGKLRVLAAPSRTDLHQELADPLVDFAIGDQALLPPGAPAQGIQRQEQNQPCDRMRLWMQTAVKKPSMAHYPCWPSGPVTDQKNPRCPLPRPAPRRAIGVSPLSRQQPVPDPDDASALQSRGRASSR